MRTGRATVAAVVLAGLAGGARADEGMWPLDRPPAGLREKHGFAPTAAWLEHLQKSCVRFSSGGSGSFVSADGLVMTNHHVGSDELEKASTPQRNLLETGFFAKTLAEELPCKDLELRVLWSTQDVTERVERAAAGAATPAEAEAARRRESSAIETEAAKATGLEADVEAFYRGARWVLHRYRRYTDVRLVMAPEQQVAFFGGDAENFEFPRHDLDVCFFRVWQDGKPLRPEHHLRWSAAGTKAGDLALVCGHPGRTRRLSTVSHLRFLRDVELPARLARGWRREVELGAFSRRGPEHARTACGDLFGVQNGRKSRTGLLAGLLDPRVFGRKEAEEAALRAAVAADPARAKAWGGGWDEVDRALAAHRATFLRHDVLVDREALGSDLYGIAKRLVRLAAERGKPSGERLREYRDAELDALLRELRSPSPIHDDLEVDRLSSGLSLLAETLGADDPTVVRALAGQSPRARAESLVRATALKDLAAREALLAGPDAVAASKDPLIRLAADLDPEYRALRKRHEDEVESVLRSGYAKIAAARFAVEGESTYPDATFTLRLAFGPVAGYREDGRDVAPFTTLGGAFRRMEERPGDPAFGLPRRWVDGKALLALDTPYDFVCTADIVGGNSGSPVVDRAGEVVGLVFDGNIQSLVLDVLYTDEQARCVCVDARAILECLRKLYGAGTLAEELTRR